MTAVTPTHTQPLTFYQAIHRQALQEVSSCPPFDGMYVYGQQQMRMRMQSDGSAFINNVGQHDQINDMPQTTAYPPFEPAFNGVAWPGPSQDSLSYNTLAQEERQDSVVSIPVSTAFHPNAHPHLSSPDRVFLSTEGVTFYVHSHVILKACKHAFRDFLGGSLTEAKFQHTPVPIDSASAELNVILHLLYGISPAAHSPALEVLENAVNRMPHYSITPKKYIIPTSPLYTLLLAIAPLHPMDVYVLAAQHKLHDLAVATSSHLLSYSLRDISDTQAERMGAIYLKKLFNLHLARLNSLKSILLTPPLPHSPTRRCNFVEQRKLTRAWALASAYIVWDSRLDFSTYNLHSSLNPLLKELDCQLCKVSLQNQIKDIIVRWTSVEVSIFSHFARLGVVGVASGPDKTYYYTDSEPFEVRFSFKYMNGTIRLIQMAGFDL